MQSGTMSNNIIAVLLTHDNSFRLAAIDFERCTFRITLKSRCCYFFASVRSHTTFKFAASTLNSNSLVIDEVQPSKCKNVFS